MIYGPALDLRVGFVRQLVEDIPLPIDEIRQCKSDANRHQRVSGAAKPTVSKAEVTPEQLQDQRKKVDLMLSRSRVLQQLEQSNRERYSELLRRTLAELDAQIAAL